MADVVPLSGDDNYLNAWEFVVHLPSHMRACRGGRNHNFIDGQQVHGSFDNGVVHEETLCARGCLVIKVEDWFQRTGHYVKDPHYKYPKGYLIKASEHGTIDRVDIPAAFRVVHYYEKRGQAVPKPPKRRRKSA